MAWIDRAAGTSLPGSRKPERSPVAVDLHTPGVNGPSRNRHFSRGRSVPEDGLRSAFGCPPPGSGGHSGSASKPGAALPVSDRKVEPVQRRPIRPSTPQGFTQCSTLPVCLAQTTPLANRGARERGCRLLRPPTTEIAAPANKSADALSPGQASKMGSHTKLCLASLAGSRPLVGWMSSAKGPGPLCWSASDIERAAMLAASRRTGRQRLGMTFSLSAQVEPTGHQLGFDRTRLLR